MYDWSCRGRSLLLCESGTFSSGLRSCLPVSPRVPSLSAPSRTHHRPKSSPNPPRPPPGPRVLLSQPILLTYPRSLLNSEPLPEL